MSRAIRRPVVNTFHTLLVTTLNTSHPRRMFSFPMATNAVVMERAVEKNSPPRMKATSKWNACAIPAIFTLATEADIVDAATASGNIRADIVDAATASGNIQADIVDAATASGNILVSMSLLEEKGIGGVSAGRHGYRGDRNNRFEFTCPPLIRGLI